jgi:hypothetical protein
MELFLEMLALNSGGSFSIRSVSGDWQTMVSKHDPIISALGDVDVAANYTWASLLVESKGIFAFRVISTSLGRILADCLLDRYGNLKYCSALILRSGQSTLAYGVSILAVYLALELRCACWNYDSGNVVLQPFNGAGGIVSLSAASGNVSTRLISTNGQQQSLYKYTHLLYRPIEATGGAISLIANNGSISTGDLYL